MNTYKNIMSKISSSDMILNTFDNVLSKAKKKKVKKKHLNMTRKERIKYYRDMLIDYKQPYHEQKIIIDGSKRKTRTIVSPSLDEVIIQHLLCTPIKDHVMKRILPNVYGSIPGRGQHDAAKRVYKWIRKKNSNTKYCLQMDIRKCFDSIDTGLLKKQLQRKFKDTKYIKSLFSIVDFQEKGLPLGFYTSHWLAHFYLLPMDEFIVHTLKPKHYIRYMDDILLFSNRKKDLHKMRNKLIKFIENNLHLRFKNNHQVYKVSYFSKKDGYEKGRAIDFIGYKFHYNRKVLRKSILRKVRAKANKIDNDGINIYLARQLTSYLGWMKHTDTMGYYERYIQKTASRSMIRKYIRDYDKRQRDKLKKQKNLIQTS